MKCIALLVVLCCIGYCASVTTSDTGAGTVYKLSVVQDVWLEGSSNKNSYNFLITGRHPDYPNKRSLLQFEDLPAECGTIEWAKMYVNYYYSHKASGLSEEYCPWISRPMEIYQVRQPWVDSQATSIQRETGVSWDEPYLDLTGTDAGPNILDTVTLYTRHPDAQFKEFDMTCAVQAWRNGDDNNGVLMRAANEDVLGRDSRWYSEEQTDSSLHAFINVLCDNPFSTGEGDPCPESVPETTSTTTTEATTTSSTTEATTTTADLSPQTCQDVIGGCPTTWPAPHTLLPHPTDCGRYCRCDHQGTVIWDMPCPAGLHFHAGWMICTWPWFSGCNK